jgi:hypothetical protein
VATKKPKRTDCAIKRILRERGASPITYIEMLTIRSLRGAVTWASSSLGFSKAYARDRQSELLRGSVKPEQEQQQRVRPE